MHPPKIYCLPLVVDAVVNVLIYKIVNCYFQPLRVLDTNQRFGDDQMVKITNHVGMVIDRQLFQYDVLPSYRTWYATSLHNFVPNSLIEPRVLETIYGAAVKLVKWTRQSPENRFFP